jgi:Zn-dependent protease with chaperone function
VPKARVILSLQLGLGALGAAVIALSLSAGFSQMAWDVPSAGALVEACKAVLPDLDASGLVTVMLLALSVGVSFLTVRSAVRRARASRRFLQTLRVVERRHDGGTTTVVFEDGAALAFCAGLLRPRVYVSTGTLEVLSQDELAAVLAHERHHAAQRDPLRLFVAGVISDGLFFAPALRRLADRYGDLAELAADRAAVRAHDGDAAALASALLAFEEADPAVVGIAPERVDHLLGDRARWGLPLALIVWAVAVLAAVGAVALRVQTSGDAPVSVPLMIAESCMLIMAVLPLAFMSGSVFGAGRLLRRIR